MDAEKRGISPCPFKRGKQERMSVFIKILYVISWFVKNDLKQIYCSYLRTQKIQNDFL